MEVKSPHITHTVSSQTFPKNLHLPRHRTSCPLGSHDVSNGSGKGKETDRCEVCIYLDAALRAFGGDAIFYSCVLTVGVSWEGGKKNRREGGKEERSQRDSENNS